MPEKKRDRQDLISLFRTGDVSIRPGDAWVVGRTITSGNEFVIEAPNSHLNRKNFPIQLRLDNARGAVSDLTRGLLGEVNINLWEPGRLLYTYRPTAKSIGDTNFVYDHLLVVVLKNSDRNNLVIEKLETAPFDIFKNHDRRNTNNYYADTIPLPGPTAANIDATARKFGYRLISNRSYKNPQFGPDEDYPDSYAGYNSLIGWTKEGLLYRRKVIFQPGVAYVQLSFTSSSDREPTTPFLEV